jgi:2-succinyl-5-enolpyruvyl-6-hydroxy-3-cyclohexene-1-carboxylate synthase
VRKRALAHDIGGLLAARRLGLQLTIVVLNNGGGGIFDFLPVASAQEPAAATQANVYEQHVATPHGLDIAKVAAVYECGYELPSSLDQLQAAVSRSLGSDGTQIIEVRSDRQENLTLHRRLADASTAALSEAGNV